MKYRFVGDPEDPKTKSWGLKKFGVYEVEKKKMFSTTVALIQTPKKGLVRCPYANENAFNRNWKLTH